MSRPITHRIRQKTGGTVGFEKWSMLGQRLVSTTDPDGVEVPEEWGKAAWLDPDFPRIPATVWNATIQLYIHFMESPDTADLIKGQTTVDSGLEVAVFFTKDIETGKVDAWVPTQAISGASVEIDYELPCINLITGERLECGVVDMPDTMVKIGTSHSHNTMWAGFSSTDDKNELGQPGMHIVAGRFKKEAGSTSWYHEIASSVVMGGARYRSVLEPDKENVGQLACRDMHYRDIIDYDSSADSTWDKGVLQLISMDMPEPIKLTGYTGGYGGQHGNFTWGRGYSFWKGQDDDDPVCPNAKCKGDMDYSGYCWKCSEYDPECDERPYTDKYQDENAQPIYDKHGNLEGYSVPQNLSKDSSKQYRYVMGRTLNKLAKRHGWLWDGGVPEEGLSKRQKKKRKDKGRSPSSHSGIGDKEVEVHVDAAIKRGNIITASKDQDRLVRYELKELAKILTFLQAQDDPSGKLMAAAFDVVELVTSVQFMDKEALDSLEDALAEYGMELEDLE